MRKYEAKIIKVLRDIIEYSGGDKKYAEHAQMIDKLEWLLRDCGVKDV